MTKAELAEQILSEYYGGVRSQDSDITPRQVGFMINKALADQAKASFYENSNLEGVAYANDEFICTFSGIELNTTDDSGYRWFDMPTAPVGLPKSRGVVFVGPMLGAKNGFKMIPASMLSVYLGSFIPQTVAWWLEGSRGYVCALDSNVQLPNTVRVKTIGRDDNDMDAEMSITMDAASKIQMAVVAMLRQQQGKDTVNDGLDLNDVR